MTSAVGWERLVSAPEPACGPPVCIERQLKGGPFARVNQHRRKWLLWPPALSCRCSSEASDAGDARAIGRICSPWSDRPGTVPPCLRSRHGDLREPESPEHLPRCQTLCRNTRFHPAPCTLFQHLPKGGGRKKTGLGGNYNSHEARCSRRPISLSRCAWLYWLAGSGPGALIGPGP